MKSNQDQDESFSDSQSSSDSYIDNNINFVVAKSDAREFWFQNWGNDLQVPFAEFVQFFQNRFGSLTQTEQLWLKEDISFSRTDQVTIYAFDIFVQLFAPWKKLKQVWRVLGRSSQACRPHTTFDWTVKRLEILSTYSYVYRMSSSHFGQWVVAYKNSRLGNESNLQVLKHF